MKTSMSLHEIGELISLSRKRNESIQDYLRFQKYQGELIIAYLFKNNVFVDNKKILDLGCGIGGYAEAFMQVSDHVVGVDLQNNFNSRKFTRVISDASTLPFLDNYYDFVLCTSMIEHVPNANQLVLEILRVTKSNGYFLLSYPPFYSIKGGHHLSPMHYFDEKTAIKLYNGLTRVFRKKWFGDDSPVLIDSYDRAFIHYGLYKRTITSIKHMLKKMNVYIVDMSTRYSPVNFARIPFLGEVLTWHVVFLIRKNDH